MLEDPFGTGIVSVESNVRSFLDGSLEFLASLLLPDDSIELLLEIAKKQYAKSSANEKRQINFDSIAYDFGVLKTEVKKAEKPPRVELNRINLEPYNFDEKRYTTKSTQTTFEVIPIIKPPLLQDVQQELGMLNRTLSSIGETIEVRK